MSAPSVIQEKLRFGRANALAGLLAYPDASSPHAAVLICSPHPNFGGDMQNNVTTAMADCLSQNAITLRFDYRGVGESQITLPDEVSIFDYWEELERSLDYTEPLADTADALNVLAAIGGALPLFAVGYSFGAIVATQVGVGDRRVAAAAGVAPPLKRVQFEHLFDCRKPALLISGRNDFVYDSITANQLISRAGAQLTFEQPDCDHFFIGTEADVANRLARFFADVLCHL